MEIKQLGNDGEQAVCSFLENEQFSIIQRNYSTRWGEVDIIAQRGEVLAFVEVKTRKHHYFSIASTVNRTKQQKIIKTAKYYVAVHQIQDKVIRFDVAAVLFNGAEHAIDYIPNAFTQSWR